MLSPSHRSYVNRITRTLQSQLANDAERHRINTQIQLVACSRAPSLTWPKTATPYCRRNYWIISLVCGVVCTARLTTSSNAHSHPHPHWQIHNLIKGRANFEKSLSRLQKTLWETDTLTFCVCDQIMYAVTSRFRDVNNYKQILRCL